jgi:hypothetical protein
MKRYNPFVFVCAMVWAVSGIFSPAAFAQTEKHLSVGVGALYERGLDATVSYERELQYHNAYEVFAKYYIKYDKDKAVDHVTRTGFWHDYHTWSLGAAYKPCLSRGRNHHGNAIIGASGGSDGKTFIGGVHAGYEHTYYLQKGWALFWQVREDVMFKARDRFRTGVSVGVKIPL